MRMTDYGNIDNFQIVDTYGAPVPDLESAESIVLNILYNGTLTQRPVTITDPEQGLVSFVVPQGLFDKELPVEMDITIFYPNNPVHTSPVTDKILSIVGANLEGGTT